MSRFFQLCSRAIHGLLGTLWSFAVWTLWLGLALLLVAQLYIVSSNELAVPGFLLRRMETRLAETGLRVAFGRTSFDPAGRILAENARVFFPGFADSILTARSVYVQLNPWMLAVGQIEPREIRITNAAVSIPAIFSPTGRPAEIVRALDATLAPGSRSFTVHQLSGRMAGINVSARGSVPLSRRPARSPAELLAEFVAQRFPVLCRQALQIAHYAAQFEQPSLHVELSPSVSGAVSMNLTLLARTMNLERPVAISATDLRANTRLLLLGDAPTSWVEFSARELNLPYEVRVRGLHGDVYGRLLPNGFHFEPRELTLTADSVTTADGSLDALSAQIFPRPFPRVDVSAVARVLDAPFAIEAKADLEAKLATATFHGALSPDLLEPLGKRLRRDFQPILDFRSFDIQRGAVKFGAGWKFEKLDARVHAANIEARGVTLSDGRAVIEVDPLRLHAPELFARIGENFAQGSFDQEFKTREFRFLLDGRLRPMEISPWFREWWRNFFPQLEFPLAPPDASVDVRGIWRDGPQTSVFVFADAPGPIIRGAKFDRVRTRLFIRPGFFDGLQVFGSQGDRSAHGRFTYWLAPEKRGWQALELALDSTLDPATAVKIVGAPVARVLQPFEFAAPPTIKFSGRFTGPGAAEGRHHDVRVEARTAGELRFQSFPLQAASFVASAKDEEIVIDDFEALFSGGVASGHARVWGTGPQRRLGFDVVLEDASLGGVAGTLQEFFARRKGEPPPPPGKFVQEKANVKLNLSASAEGSYNDPLSFRGEGNAILRGAGIGEVPLLGTLSELLKFTTLRFNEGQANFKIEGAKIVFPELTIRGADALIDAHGSYALDRRTLDFKARIFPFQESGNLIKTVVGAVLTPLSNALEVKLTGSLEDPEWVLLLGPTNFLRSLTPPESTGTSEPTAAEPSQAPAPVEPAPVANP